MAKIMIVEDDAVIQQMLATTLTNWGYETYSVVQFDKVLEEYQVQMPELILLDITLPLYNGYYWCQAIRKVSNVPILVVSSRQEPVDIVMAINMGADDFITKPFDLSVLVAKIQGLLRRSYEFTNEASRLEYQQVVLDLKSAILLYEDHMLELTKNEFQMIRILFEHNGNVVSREALMTQLWHSDIFIDDNTLTVNVARLRRKLGDIGLAQLIVTKKGVGYKLGNAHG